MSGTSLTSAASASADRPGGLAAFSCRAMLLPSSPSAALHAARLSALRSRLAATSHGSPLGVLLSGPTFGICGGLRQPEERRDAQTISRAKTLAEPSANRIRLRIPGDWLSSGFMWVGTAWGLGLGDGGSDPLAGADEGGQLVERDHVRPVGVGLGQIGRA